MNMKRKLAGAIGVILMATVAAAGDTRQRDAAEPPLVVSYRTNVCDRPPCPQIRSVSRPPDFQGTFELKLHKRVLVCTIPPCPPIVRFHLVSSGGFSRLAESVVLHGERREHNQPLYYASRLKTGFFLGGSVTIHGDCWFDETSGRLEILVRSGISKERERDIFKYGTPIDL
jgi:hypothetical protein